MTWLTILAVLLFLVALEIASLLRSIARALTPSKSEAVAGFRAYGGEYRTVIDQMAAFMVEMDRRQERIEESLASLQRASLHIEDR